MFKKTVLMILVALLACPALSLSHAQNIPDKAKLLADIERVKGLSDKERETLRQAIQKIPEEARVSKKNLQNVSKEEKKRALEIMKMNPELVREYQKELSEIDVQGEVIEQKKEETLQDQLPANERKLHPNWDTLPESQKRALQAWEEKKNRQKEMRAKYKQQVRQRSLNGSYDDFQ